MDVPMPTTPPSPSSSSRGSNHLPRTPPSPTSTLSSSAVSATADATRSRSPLVSRSRDSYSPSIDVTPSGAFIRDDYSETSISMTPHRSALPRGDLGKGSWQVNLPSLSSPSVHEKKQTFRAPPPVSPPSSPQSHSREEFEENDMEPNDNSPSQVPHHHPLGQDDGGGVGGEYSGAVVWGTNVSVEEAMFQFQRFLQEFHLENDDVESSTPYYAALLHHMHRTQQYVMNINCFHLCQFNSTQDTYKKLIRFPQVLIRVLDMVVRNEYIRLFGDIPMDASIQVRTFNLHESKAMRDLNPCDIDQLVSVKGMIIRCSSVIPDLKQAFFRCSVCSAECEVEIDRGRIEEPTGCESCMTKFSMKIIHNRCSFTDKQMVKMQETPDTIPDGETPQTITLFAFDDLVDAVRPGDKIEVTGIFRAVPHRISSKMRTIKSVFKTYIDVIHFKKSVAYDDNDDNDDSHHHYHQDDKNEHKNFDPEKVAEFQQLAKDPLIYQKLTDSLAPSIWELEDVKKGLLCQLFGGSNKEIHGAPQGKFRAEMNILLCGDPGTSKSQLLSYVHKIAPRGIYTSGKGSSAVGLTASVIRDVETGDLVLESGALVLSDQGICCIDEFDKMNESARSVLHEAMEQQTVSIAKAGIICSLNAQTSILASANPIESRYNPKKSVIDNICILPTLLSRFDLIYLILDNPNPETDRRLAKHIVGLYYQHAGSSSAPIPMKTLAEYIGYAKKTINPVISDAATRDLIKGYLDMRKLGSHRGSITATPRQLESLIRISEAHAKLRLSSTVEREDVYEAIRLMNVATQRAATDPRTGTIDMDMITTGHSAMDRDAADQLTAQVKEVLMMLKRSTVNVSELRKEIEVAKNIQVKHAELQTALRSLAEENFIQLLHGTIRLMKTYDS